MLGRKSRFFGIVLLFAVALFYSAGSDAAADDPMTVWFDEPAAKWLEAFPLGNGRMGGMVFGGVKEERIGLNEESLWAGEPVDNIPPKVREHLDEIRTAIFNEKHDRVRRLLRKYMAQRPTSFRSFQPLGSLMLRFPEREDATDYRRELDMRDGVARTTFRADGTRFVREAFISAPDDVLVVHLASQGSGTINTNITLTRPQDASVRAVADDVLLMEGQIVDVPPPEGPEPNPGGSGPGGKHMRFATRLEVRTEGGSCRAADGELRVRNASSATILLTAATDYDLETMDFDRSIQPARTCRRILEKAAGKTCSKLRARHMQDHRAFFDRVKLDLGDSPHPDLPLDERMKKVRDGAHDPQLVEQYFQFGRYLLMGSSRRPGRLPANLQGVWSRRMWAPWEADYHLDINLQMNYWLADLCTLSETVKPLRDFTQRLSEHGRDTAREMYGARGWVAHICTNVFGRTTPGGSTIGSQLTNGMFPLGGAWLTLGLWRHYEFTGDREYLEKEIYPVLRSSARFVLDFLVEGPNGHLVTAPSMSPEANFITSDGKSMRVTYAPTMDIQIVHALFERCIAASRILGKDAELRGEMQQALDRLPPQQIGENGTIQEWIKDYKEASPGHRHVSHLLGLHPADSITPETPELFEAARKTIERRLKHGGGSTGWSRAWTINFYARLCDGESAYKHAYALIRGSTAPNLFDMHPPFQIDGNFGGTSGIAEMLLQSHRGRPGDRIIDILPALPSEWKKGHIKGLRARGDFTVDIRWQKGRPVEVKVKSGSGNTCWLSYGGPDRVISFPTTTGETYIITGLKEGPISEGSVRTEAGEKVDYAIEDSTRFE